MPDEATRTFNLDDICRLNVAVWFELHGAIKPKAGPVMKAPELRVNYLQKLESDVLTYCRLNKIPARILKLKPRQRGSSTFSVAALYHFLSMTLGNGCIIGGSHDQGGNLFKMLRLYAEYDSFDKMNPCRVVEGKARWANGSECVQQTASNPEAGRSGTFEALVATEVARWAEDGVANAGDVLAGLLKCVPYKAGTLVELETTANGASGDFYNRWQNGITFEELKEGKRGYVKIFAPWFAFAESRMEPSVEGISSEEDLSAREKDLMAEYKLDLHQVAWMRWSIREECKGDFDVFQEDYPFDDETAFRTSGRRRFNPGQLKRMVERAKVYPPQLGSIEPQGDRYVWRNTSPEETRIIRWEAPKVGYRYVVSVDVMTGASQVKGKDPDNHAVGVIRAGTFVTGRGWMPPKLVARLVSDWPAWEREREYGLRWDIDVLEEQVFRLASYYGNCLIVPEINMDRGLVELLRLRPANIYMREQFNRKDETKVKAFGFQTTSATREMVVENLARGIREQGTEGEGVDIFCPITLAEMQAFIVKPNGRSEAMHGKKDDCVMQMAIGLSCMEGATAYSEPTVERPLAPEILRLLAAEGALTGGMSMRF